MRAVILQGYPRPSFDVTRSELSDFTDLGELGKKKKGGIIKRLHRAHRKIFKKILPKPLRRVFSTKGFLKMAPILAVVAQVLNVIPGLGIAVGLAITAGAMALKVATNVAAKKQAKSDQVKAEKEANAQANAAFDQSQGYFTQKYGVTDEQFKGMALSDKLNFLQVAAEDGDKEAKGGQGIFSVVEKETQAVTKTITSAVSKLGLGSGLNGPVLILLFIGALALSRRSR